MIVVDAGLIVEALTVRSSAAAGVVRSADVMVSPAHLDAEAGHAIRGLVRGGLLSVTEGEHCLADLTVSMIARAPLAPLLTRAFELRANLTFYDALYVSLAEAYRLPLVTTDARLSRAPGFRCEIDVVEIQE
ncbi:MAG: type II toxin-antitoxin system VapC family toxin [Nocardioides sp.]